MPVIQSTKAASPPGKIAPFAQSAVPAGWLACNGASVATATYPALFAAIGYTYGGAGASFSLPDLRGEFLRGADGGRGVDAGRTVGSWQYAEIVEHSHAIYGQDNSATPTGSAASEVANIENPGAPGALFNRYTQTVGGSETRPRNVAVLYCIKT